MYLFFAANPKKPATFDAKKRMMDAAASSGFLCAELEELAPVAWEDGILIVIGGDGSIIRNPCKKRHLAVTAVNSIVMYKTLPLSK